MSTPMYVEGLEDPTMRPASKADLSADEPVIGIVVGGQARAYPLSRLTGMMEHVVNDVVEVEEGKTVPLVVTYCDAKEWVRVMVPEDETITDSLHVGTMGMLNGGLALNYDGETYLQMATIPGLQDYEYELVSWYAWRQDHPQTLVFAGRSHLPSR